VGASEVEDQAGGGEGVVLKLTSAAEAALSVGLIAALKRCAAQKLDIDASGTVRKGSTVRWSGGGRGPSTTQCLQFVKALLRSG
jgi:hypothetical protein